MNYLDIMHFLIAVEEVETAEKLIVEFQRMLHAYSIPFYLVFHPPRSTIPPARMVLSGNWPETWVERYVDKKYILIDPSVRYLLSSQHPFTWKQSLKAFAGSSLERRMKDMMRDAATHGLHEGGIFPVHGRMGLVGALSIGGDKLDLSPSEMSLFHVVAMRLFFRLRDFIEPKQDFTPDWENTVQLTPRSIEALALLAEGMTSQEISKRLGLSRHTVDWHFNNIQDKLNARNRQHSVAIAMRLGLIS